MTDALSTTVPAGWYPDPWGSTSQRWWDGSAWSGRLYPQSDESAPEQHHGSPPTTDAQRPTAGQSTFEAPSYASAPAPSAASPFPSRRALRQLAAAGAVSPADSAEPVASVAPPVWTAAPEAAPATEPATQPEAPVAIEPAEVKPAEVAPPAEPAVPVAVAPITSFAVSGPITLAATSAAAASETDDGWAASLAWDEAETTTAPPEALPIFGDAPPVSYSHRAMRYQPRHGRTSPVWLIVMMPLLQGAAIVGSFYLFPGIFSFDGSLASFVPTTTSLSAMRDWLLLISALNIAFFLFTLILGFQDRARLRLLGHEETASPWWIVLQPLVYLIVRSVRVNQCTGRRGSGPLTTYLCLYVAPPIALMIATAVITALDGAIPV